MFWRKKTPLPKLMDLKSLDFNSIPILKARDIINLLSLETRIKSIEKLTASGSEYFEQLYMPALVQYIESAQLVPASASHHHAGPGGLVTHTLDVIDCALRMRKSYNLPLQAPAEVISAQEHIWTFAIFAGALLHDAGKLVCNTRIKLNTGVIWTPHDISILDTGATHYKVLFEKSRYNLHTRLANGLIHLLPAQGRGWLAQQPDILAQVTAWLNGDLYECGVIGEIVRRADGESVARNLKTGGERGRFPGAPTVPLVDRITTALRQLLDNGQLRVNRPDGSAGWCDDHYTYLVCGTVADAVRNSLQSTGAKDIPTDNTRIFDTWQEHGFVESTPDHRAIWHLTVNNRMTLTVLKFETSRLFHPSRRPEKYAGELCVSADKPGSTAQSGYSVTTQNPTSSASQNAVTDSTRLQPHFSDQSGISDTTQLQMPTTTQSAGTPSSQQSVSSHVQSAVTQSTQNDTSHFVDDQIPLTETRLVSQPSETQDIVDSSSINHNPFHVKDFYMDDDLVVDGKAAVSPVTTNKKLSAEDPNLPQHFLDWVKAGIRENRIHINRRDALVHIVKEGVLLVSPSSFKTFLRDHQLVDYAKYPDRLEAENKAATLLQGKLVNMMSKAKLHRKTSNGLNIHTYLIQGKEKESKIKGWLLPTHVLFGDTNPATNQALSNISGFEAGKLQGGEVQNK